MNSGEFRLVFSQISPDKIVADWIKSGPPYGIKLDKLVEQTGKYGQGEKSKYQNQLFCSAVEAAVYNVEKGNKQEQAKVKHDIPCVATGVKIYNRAENISEIETFLQIQHPE